MSFLADTNIILRLTQPQHSMYAAAFTSLATLRRRGEIGYLTSQNLIEFWRTCTRPVDQNGLGMTIIEAETELNRVENRFPLLPDLPDIYPQWRRLVTTYAVKGVNVHDARLVAAMLVHGLTHILTFNTTDFRRYAEITSVNPREITD